MISAEAMFRESVTRGGRQPLVGAAPGAKRMRSRTVAPGPAGN
jgi:hypothetical protein